MTSIDRRLHGVAFSLLAISALSRVAAAAPSGGGIVLESYAGPPPADAVSVLQPLYAALIKRAFVAQDKLVTVLGESVSRSGGQMSASQSADAQKLVEQGFSHFIDGDYAKSLALETQALSAYQGAPTTLSKEPSLRDLEFKAFVVAGRSAEALGKGDQAFGFISEAIRMFPDRAINAAEFDPTVKALYKRVKDELTRRGPGTLEVRVDDATVVIFVDERFVGTGQVKLDSLLPGRYRVLATKGDLPGRVHDVEVPAHGRASVDVSWEIDSRLRTRNGYVGLEAPLGAGSDGEVNAAVKIGRAVGAKQVVILGIRTVEGRRAIVAYSITAESQNKVFGAVQIEPIAPAPATVDRLAALMAGDKVDDAGIITKEPPPARHVIGTRPSALHKLKWVFASGAVVALGAGGALIELDSQAVSGTTRAEMYRDSKNLGIGVAVGGAALAAVAIYMFAADQPIDIEENAGHVAVAPTLTSGGMGLTVMGRF